MHSLDSLHSPCSGQLLAKGKSLKFILGAYLHMYDFEMLDEEEATVAR